MAHSILTTALATKLEYYWQISSEITLSDEDICDRVGITYKQLKTWLDRNTKVQRESGDVEGVAAIRARARASMLTSYLQRHLGLLIKAEAAGDIKNAHKILCWLEVKQFPHRFNTPPQRVDPAPPEGTGSVEVSATIENGKVWESVVKSESQQAASGDPTLAAKNGS